MAETEEPTKENHASATYQQGIDDFYQSQAESQKKKLDTIHGFFSMGRHLHQAFF